MTVNRLLRLLSVAALLAAALLAAPAAATAQEGGLDPASLVEPLEESWPTYSGDYSGRRYSRLKQVTTENVRQLSLAWTRNFNTGMPPLDGPNAPDFTGGEGGGRLHHRVAAHQGLDPPGRRPALRHRP